MEKVSNFRFSAVGLVRESVKSCAGNWRRSYPPRIVCYWQVCATAAWRGYKLAIVLMLGLWRTRDTELYNARKFGCKTEIVQSLAANPDKACCLAFLDQPEVLVILKNIPQLKLYKALEAHHSL